MSSSFDAKIRTGHNTKSLTAVKICRRGMDSVCHGLKSARKDAETVTNSYIRHNSYIRLLRLILLYNGSNVVPAGSICGAWLFIPGLRL